MGVATKRAISYDFNLRQQGSQSSGRGTLRSASLPTNQHAADLRAYCVQDQGHSHPVLAYDGGEGEN
jgi:hypothetical protein